MKSKCQTEDMPTCDGGEFVGSSAYSSSDFEPRAPGHSYFWALEKAVSITSPIGCQVRPSN